MINDVNKVFNIIMKDIQDELKQLIYENEHLKQKLDSITSTDKCFCYTCSQLRMAGK